VGRGRGWVKLQLAGGWCLARGNLWLCLIRGVDRCGRRGGVRLVRRRPSGRCAQRVGDARALSSSARHGQSPQPLLGVCGHRRVQLQLELVRRRYHLGNVGALRLPLQHVRAAGPQREGGLLPCALPQQQYALGGDDDNLFAVL